MSVYVVCLSQIDGYTTVSSNFETILKPMIYTVQYSLSDKCAQQMLNSVLCVAECSIMPSTCWTAVERCWTEWSSRLFISTSCRLLNDVQQSFSGLVLRGVVGRSNIATETAAVLEWNFENATEVINIYEKFPCLYDVAKIEYKNCNASDKAVL